MNQTWKQEHNTGDSVRQILLNLGLKKDADSNKQDFNKKESIARIFTLATTNMILQDNAFKQSIAK